MGGAKDEEVGMLVRDPFQANDWGFRQFALLVLTFQIMVLLLMVLDGHGLVPLHLRGLFAFLFYSYVPGLVLLRVLRMHRLGGAMTTLLSVAASVSIMMFSGFIMNMVHLELHGPLPFTQLAVAFGQTLTLLMLLGLAFITDRHYEGGSKRDLSPFLTAPAFALYSLPLMAVLSTYLLNGWNIAWLQVALLLLVSAAVLSLAVMRVPSQLYPLAVVCIALAVLFHNSLVSRFVVEWADISFEYLSANKVMLDGFWTTSAMDHRTDSVLSITVLAPIYALLVGLDLNMVFKACYPVLLAMVPLAVFIIAEPLTGSRGALLAAFFIISGSVFFTELLGLARQVVAELLLVATVALLLYCTTVPTSRTFLAWFLALGMIVSHYGIIAMTLPAAFASGILFLLFAQGPLTRGTLMKMVSYAALLLFSSILWYSCVSGSMILDGVTSHFGQLIDGNHSIGLFDDLIPILSFQTSLHLWPVFALAVLACVLSFYGVYRMMISKRPLDVRNRAHLAAASPFLAFTFLAFMDINLFNFIGRERFIHVCLLFIVPLAIYGGMQLSHALAIRARSMNKVPPLILLGSIITILFLASTGVVGYAAGISSNTSLDNDIISVPRHSDGTFLAANFTVDRGKPVDTIIADAHRAYLLEMLGGGYQPLFGKNEPDLHYGANAHLFLGSENLEGMLWLEDPDYYRINKNYVPISEELTSWLGMMDKIYSSQEAELYYRKF